MQAMQSVDMEKHRPREARASHRTCSRLCCAASVWPAACAAASSATMISGSAFLSCSAAASAKR